MLRSLLFALALVLPMLPAAHADVLLINAIAHEPPNSAKGILRPHRGTTMKQVLAKFGPPQRKLPAVGKPPITRWVYPQYTVYFEYQYVIHSVLHSTAMQAAVH